MKTKCTIAIACTLLLLAAGTQAAGLPEFTDLVEKAAPAVVNISAQKSKRTSSRRFEERDVPEFFRRFFRDMPHETPRARPSLGSGFILSSDGYIITNHHVVEDADEIIVSLNDRREREAELIGADPLSDLALLKIDAADLPRITTGSSKDLKVGEWVLAIGSPFGFEYSVTAGIVSAVGRSLPENNGNYVPFIQTDVAINPGNSGGPLFNLKGEVIGINSQIFTRSGGFMGLSFAIPIDVALEVVEQLKDKGSVSRGWLGVLIQRVDRDLAESFGLDRPSGALVTQVFADSPAEAAGLRDGDIITAFDDIQIDLSSDLPHVVGRTKAESEVEVEIVRNGKRQTLDVTVGVLSDDSFRSLRSSGPEPSNRLGLLVEELTDDMKAELRVKGGVLVSDVQSGPARTVGIRKGDVITMLDNQIISSVARFEEVVDDLPEDSAVSVRIVRDGSPEFLALRITD